MTKIKESVEENLIDEDLAKSAGGSQEAVTIFSTVTVSAEVVSWGTTLAAM